MSLNIYLASSTWISSNWLYNKNIKTTGNSDFTVNLSSSETTSSNYATYNGSICTGTLRYSGGL